MQSRVEVGDYLVALVNSPVAIPIKIGERVRVTEITPSASYFDYKVVLEGHTIPEFLACSTNIGKQFTILGQEEWLYEV